MAEMSTVDLVHVNFKFDQFNGQHFKAGET